MSLTIEEFERIYPDAFHWESRKNIEFGSNARVKEEGFLEFTVDTASIFAGPFAGNHAMFFLKDNTETLVPVINEKTKAREKVKLIEANDRFYQNNPELIVEGATSAKPYSLYLCGNDDTSYTKFYASIAEAEQELELLKTNEPLEFKDIMDLGFVFTNL